MAEGRKNEDVERGEALVDRLARQRIELEARRRAESSAEPPAPPAPVQRDGRPRPPGGAPAPEPRRAGPPLGPPGNPPRTRTPFKSAPAQPEASAPAAFDPPAPEASAPETPRRTRFEAPAGPDPFADFDGVEARSDIRGETGRSASPDPAAPSAEGEGAPPEPFALERRRLRVPKAETPPVFPEDEEEEEEALDLTERAPQTRTARTRPFSGFEWNVALRYLRARRKDGFISAISWLSLVGIALGVAALIVVMAVMTGFRHEMVNQILGVNAHVSLAPQQTAIQRRPFTNYDAVAARLSSTPGVIQAAPVIHGQVMASNPQSTANSIALVRGVRLEDFRRMKAVADPETAEGALTAFREDQGVAIGSGLALMLNLRVGERITLISPDGDLTPMGVRPRIKSYPIAYVFKLGMSELDSALLYMPLEEAQIYFNKEGVVDGIEVISSDPQNIERLEPTLQAAAGEPMTIMSWKSQSGGYISALDTERRVMRLILSLIILIAAFNIVSGLIMLVKEKGRDVAILRTIGASRGAILRIFFICGASIGVMGTLLGVSLGVLIAPNIPNIQTFLEGIFGAKLFPGEIYFLSRMPSRLQWSDVATTAAISLGVSFLATIFPARRAARLDPVEALRYE
ncbi:lipoprotein-releasing ABC transporter permease subunit [Neomegalonema sp.]|uniref:lipoprotein-releasing ABC transporter permease subunit n=1 Tax=Neomegalonema sp. TaxID=2039713 RepID=UPI00262B1C2E|nr:lipoprotein-releasing ABC transporter permease subunit [Neomegalonema sp.]MDD2867162.1 lipoprotein-releasing ABC transporter permease subunit [Neomegalonema sp.]